MTWIRVFREFTLWQVIILVAIDVAYSQLSPSCSQYESHYCACSPDEKPELMTLKMCLYYTTKGYICHACPIYLQDQVFCEECFGISCLVCFQNIFGSKELYNRMHSYVRNSSSINKDAVEIFSNYRYTTYSTGQRNLGHIKKDETYFSKSSDERGNANNTNDSIVPERKYMKNAKQGYHQNKIFEQEEIKSSTKPADNSEVYVYDNLVQRNRSDGHVIISRRDTDARVKRSFIETNDNDNEVAKKTSKDLLSDASYLNSSTVKLTTGSGMENLGYYTNGEESKNSNVQRSQTKKFPHEEWSSKSTYEQPALREKDNLEIKKIHRFMNKHEVKMNASQNLSENLNVYNLDNNDVESKTRTISAENNPEINHEVSVENSEDIKLKQDSRNESALHEEFPKYVSANLDNSNPYNTNLKSVLNIETNESDTEVVKKTTKYLISDANYLNSSNVQLATGSGMENVEYNTNGGESKNSGVQNPHTIKLSDEEWSSKSTYKQPAVQEKDNVEIKNIHAHEIKMDASQNLSQNLIVYKLDNKHDVESKTHSISADSNPEIDHEVSFETSEDMKLKQDAINESALQEEFPKYVSANIRNSIPHNKNSENVLNVKESNGTKNIQIISEFDNTDYAIVENGDISKSFHGLHEGESTEDHVHKKTYAAKIFESNVSDKQISSYKSSREKCETKKILNANRKKYAFPTYNFRCEIYSGSNHSALNTTGSKKNMYSFDKKNLRPLLRQVFKCLSVTNEYYRVVGSKIEVVVSNCPFSPLPDILTTLMHTYVNQNENNAEDVNSPVLVLHQVNVKLSDSLNLSINAFTKHTISQNSSDDNLTKISFNDTGKLVVVKGQLRINMTLSLINSHPDESESKLPPLKRKPHFLYSRKPLYSDMLKYASLSSNDNFLKKTLIGNPKKNENSPRTSGHASKQLQAEDDIFSSDNRKISINVNSVNFPIIHMNPILVFLKYNQETSPISLLMNRSRYGVRKDNRNEYQDEFQRINGTNSYNLEDNSSADEEGDEEVLKYSLRTNGKKNYYSLHPEAKNTEETLWTRNESRSEISSMRFFTRRLLENFNKENEEEPDRLIIRLMENDNASNSKPQEVIKRTKRQMPQNAWCPIDTLRRFGNMECTVWSYKKLCKLECHPEYFIYGKSEETFNCKRKENEWTPAIIIPCSKQLVEVTEFDLLRKKVPQIIPEVLHQIKVSKPDDDSEPEDPAENDEDSSYFGDYYHPDDTEELSNLEREDKELESDYEYEEQALTEEAFDYTSL